MASFTTRVELHTEQPSDYTVLHDAMEKAGFNRFIISNDGISYHLPMAEYNLSGNYGKDEVLEKAKVAVKTTGKEAAILITESNGRTWSGLKKVS